MYSASPMALICPYAPPYAPRFTSFARSAPSFWSF